MRTPWAAVCLFGACACSSGEGGTANGHHPGSETDAGANSQGDGSDAGVASAGGRASSNDSGSGGASGGGPTGCGTGGAIGYSLRIQEIRVSLGTVWANIAGGSVSACLNGVCTNFGIPGGSAPPAFATLASASSSMFTANATAYVDLHDDDGALSVTVDWSLDSVPAESDIFSTVVTNFENRVVATDRELATYQVPSVCPCTGPCGSATLTELSPESDAGAHDASADHDF